MLTLNERSVPVMTRERPRARKPLSIAYMLQNAGNDLRADVGQAILIKHTVRGLTDAGHTVDVVRLEGRSVVRYTDVDNFDTCASILLGVTGTTPFRIVESGLRRLQRELNLPYLAAFDGFRFYDACRRLLPGYLICHEYAGLFSIGAALACREIGLPYVLSVDADPFVENAVKGTPLRGLRAWLAAQEARITYRLAQKIICVSEPARQHLIDTWDVDPAKIAVIPNGVDTERFHPGLDARQVRDTFCLADDPVVIFVGGFQQWHGLDLLVDAFTHVRAAVPDAKLLLVGDGPARPQIEQQIAARGVRSAAVITGFVPQTQVPHLLAAADVAVLPYPTLPEDLWFSPLKLYEYMATGKAIVASRAGQITDVLQDGDTGLLVPAGDVADLATAIRRLLSDTAERKRIGCNARREAIERHSWEHRIRQLEDVYFDVYARCEI